MILGNLIKYGFMAICILQNAVAMQSNQTLIIGARPWDKNMEGFNGLETADFVDFMNMGAPTPLPSNFYHCDINDKETYSAAKLSDFTNNHKEQYKTIVIDWITYQHIHADNAWSHFEKLLKENGSLIVPVLYASFKEGPLSHQKAEEFVNTKNFTTLFGHVEIFNYDDISQDSRCDLLCRPNLEPGRLEDHRDMKPVIIVATKQNKKEENINTLSNNEKSVERKEFNLPSPESIKKQLMAGNHTILNGNDDSFSAQSIFGTFFGFRPEALDKGFDNVIFKHIANSVDTEGMYRLFIDLDIIVPNNQFAIKLFLKSNNSKSTPYIIEGGVPTSNQNYYKVTDWEKIKIFY